MISPIFCPIFFLKFLTFYLYPFFVLFLFFFPFPLFILFSFACPTFYWFHLYRLFT
ncbi:MAG: hypothetical protein BSOLF_2020 [Candidatus Carbobacillus altaicus]|uniref:Uncharacterized protein n=1 Tax=Candidatus Carbonibacillus altaicus TaxID=2163959 RepID=A0A2R6Y3P8_9BACL|nr:MAG: hypothetical protein BSOLF_2020 [Candidatus Carbobacillus altaicus]